MHLGFGEKAVLLVLFLSACAVYLPLKNATIILLLTITTILVQQYKSITIWKRRGIDGPPANLFLGNILEVVNDKFKFFLDNRSYGGVYGIHLLGDPILVITDPEMLKEILIKNLDSFIDRETPPFVQGKCNILNYTLFILKGKRWKSVRSIASRSFTTAKLKLVFPVMIECILLAKQRLNELLENGDCDFETRKNVGPLVMDIVAKAAFGMETGVQSGKASLFMTMADKLLDISFTDPRIVMIALFPNISIGFCDMFNRQPLHGDINKYFIGILKEIVAQKLKASNSLEKRQDYLETVLCDSVLNDKDSEFGERNHDTTKLSEMETISQCFVFIAAGYETTTITLEFALFSMAVNPDVQQLAYEEACAVIGTQGELNYEKIAQLHYINKIIMETLRLYPPFISINRQCTSDIYIKGVFFEKGQIVFSPVHALHYDERIYPKPTVFDPERFNNDTSFTNKMTYMPFGQGPRNCIGMRFALLEMRTILASLLMDYEFSAPDYAQGSTLEIDVSGFTKPAKKIVLRVKRRA